MNKKAAVDMNTTGLFVFLVCFWILAAVITSVFGQQLTKSDITGIQGDTGFSIAPLLQVMTFQIADGVPGILSLFLDAIFIFTLFIGYSLIRG